MAMIPMQMAIKPMYMTSPTPRGTMTLRSPKEEQAVPREGTVGETAGRKLMYVPVSSLRVSSSLLPISREQAEKACEMVDDEDKYGCVFDVMATNDMEVVGLYKQSVGTF